jgi:hypothetical protein
MIRFIKMVVRPRRSYRQRRSRPFSLCILRSLPRSCLFLVPYYNYFRFTIYSYDTPLSNSLSGTANLDCLSCIVRCPISLRTGHLVRQALLWRSRSSSSLRSRGE